MTHEVPTVPSATVKCLVWDLDDTLWQGVLLEDEQVVLPDPIRAVIIGLDARGILQSVCSRNDHEPAWARLRALGVAEYLVAPQIGWGRKSDAVRRIADHLGFALGTIAFIDDQPAERAEVAFHLPQVRCYDAGMATTLLDRPEFTPTSVTVDARRRRQMYQAGQRRADEQARFTGPAQDFLRSLELVMRIRRADAATLSRVEELTLRTSQMNATGVHYPDRILRALMADPRYEVLVTTLTDRFGPHGAVGVLVLEKHPGVWHLRLLATSCRVVSFGTGTVLLTWLVDQAARAGVHLIADFRPNDRNRMMEVAYRFAGFGEEPCACRDRIAVDVDRAVQRLHLVARRQPAPSAFHLTAPDLTAPDLTAPDLTAPDLAGPASVGAG
ncbi:HAD-IIIC family phosphatase [Micromonospora rifamycinica]|uniref:HAD-IIIC family phosphatase n=1 Tax=Micromonospora rifamycinica TaxID=291594 RepID=UPI0033D944D1